MATNNADAAHVVQDFGVNIGSLNANELNATGADVNEGGQRIGNMRDRLFHVMVVKVAVSYSSIVTAKWRRVIEFFVLCCAVSMLLSLIYIHYVTSRYPATCLSSIKHTWPRKGVLRVEVIQNLQEFEEQFYDGAKGVTRFNLKEILQRGPKAIPADARSGSILSTIHFNFANSEDLPATNEDWIEVESEVRPVFTYVVEYSLYHGLIKLPAQLRYDYKVEQMLYRIDGDNDSCLNSWRERMLTRYLIGDDDLIMSSLRSLVENDTEKGYLRDLLTGEHYHFVTTSVSKASYLSAFLIMLIFTFAISMLLRFSHHQIFLFILDLLQMFELAEPLVFPIAPLLTVILALVGMEAIMSEIFNDTSTAFYVILLVWMADQYDAICCRSSISRKHWLRFFYLYHFAYYAYQYKFSGQYNFFALLTSAMFILHAQIFFFHHYEIPLILHQEQLTRMQGNGTEFVLINRGISAPRRAAETTTTGEANGDMPTTTTATATSSVVVSSTPQLNMEVITTPANATAADGMTRPPLERVITFSYSTTTPNESTATTSGLGNVRTTSRRTANTSTTSTSTLRPTTNRRAASALRNAASTVADNLVTTVVDELFDRQQLDSGQLR